MLEKSRDDLKAAHDAKSDSILELERQIDVLAQEKNCVESDGQAAQEKSAREISTLSSSLAIAESTVDGLRTDSQALTDVNMEQLATVKEDLARVLDEKNAAEVLLDISIIFLYT